MSRYPARSFTGLRDLMEKIKLTTRQVHNLQLKSNFCLAGAILHSGPVWTGLSVFRILRISFWENLCHGLDSEINDNDFNRVNPFL